MNENLESAKKAAALLASAIAAFGSLVGCNRTEANAQPVPNDPVPAYHSDYKLTERQAQIARDLKCSEEDVERMLSGDIRYTEYSNILYAEALLDHLIETYGINFKVTGVHSPELMDRTWGISAVVDGGEYDGKAVHCTWVWRGDKGSLDEPYYTDNVLVSLRGGELEDWLVSVVQEELSGFDVLIKPGTSRPAGEISSSDCKIDATLRQLSKKIDSHVSLYFPPWCKLTEREYKGVLSKLFARITDTLGNGALVHFYTCKILSLADGTVPTSDSFDYNAVRDSIYNERDGAAEGKTYEWEYEGYVSEWSEN